MHTLRATGGTAVVVADDEDIVAAQLALAANEGLYLEASAATGVPAAAQLAADGVVAADDLVVVIGTSTGLKDVASTAARLDEVPVIEPTLAALVSRLDGG